MSEGLEADGTGTRKARRGTGTESVRTQSLRNIDDIMGLPMTRLDGDTSGAPSGQIYLRKGGLDRHARAMGEIAHRIEVNLSVLWESTSEASSQVLARSVLVGEVNKIDKQVGLWRAAEQTKRDRKDKERITREYLQVAGADIEMDD
ncbi:hypothetical protein FISHEDRAFT_68697 [Fistulina hepatica ATCC 64428]|uniref:Uncharacterized protein n=1 Tax=Fistulina hepatica ATCC 64428 TaxID=1128425 RepID=A0A0D7AP13_9AGAR|nr:hypothetical protein FISHEDRAFT_68697 [Fistulina hepatica ATCC 64428]